MKAKKPSMEELKKILEEFKKDPKLVEMAKQFVIRHGGRIPS
mgnify:CR=1 FL=1